MSRNRETFLPSFELLKELVAPLREASMASRLRSIAHRSWSDDENDENDSDHDTLSTSLPSVSSHAPLLGEHDGPGDDDNLAVTLGPLSSLRNKNSVLQFQNQDFQFRVLRRLSGVQSTLGVPESSSSPARSVGVSSPACKPAAAAGGGAPAAGVKLKKLSPIRQGQPHVAAESSPDDVTAALTPSNGALLLTAGSPLMTDRRRLSLHGKPGASGKRSGTPEGLQPREVPGRGARLQPRRLSALVVGSLEGTGGGHLPEPGSGRVPPAAASPALEGTVASPAPPSALTENVPASLPGTARRTKELQPLSVGPTGQERAAAAPVAVLSPRSMNTMDQRGGDGPSCVSHNGPATSRALPGLKAEDKLGKAVSLVVACVG